MTEASSANLELAILLPLGVVANQLMRIEAELRLLNMKALNVAKERENQRLSGLIEARLDSINDVLDSIRGLVSDIAADIHPRPINPTRSSIKEPRPDRDD
jgi:ubiquinone biosynthesis protein COQ9